MVADVIHRWIPVGVDRHVILLVAFRVFFTSRVEGVPHQCRSIPTYVAFTGFRIFGYAYAIGDVGGAFFTKPDVRNLFIQADVIAFNNDFVYLRLSRCLPIFCVLRSVG